MANHQFWGLPSRCYGQRLACAQQAIIVISLTIMGLSAAMKLATSSHINITQPISSPHRPNHHSLKLNESFSRSKEEANEASEAKQERLNNELVAAYLVEGLDQLFTLGLDQLVSFVHQSHESQQVAKQTLTRRLLRRFRRHLELSEPLAEVNETTTFGQKSDTSTTETPDNDNLMTSGATTHLQLIAAPSENVRSSLNRPSRSSRAKKQRSPSATSAATSTSTSTTTPTPAYSPSPSYTGTVDSPLGYAATAPTVSSVDLPEYKDIQVSNEQPQQQAYGAETADPAADGSSNNAARPPRRKSAQLANTNPQPSVRIPAPEHSPLKDTIGGGYSPNEVSLDEAPPPAQEGGEASTMDAGQRQPSSEPTDDSTGGASLELSSQDKALNKLLERNLMGARRPVTGASQRLFEDQYQQLTNTGDELRQSLMDIRQPPYTIDQQVVAPTGGEQPRIMNPAAFSSPLTNDHSSSSGGNSSRPLGWSVPSITRSRVPTTMVAHSQLRGTRGQQEQQVEGDELANLFFNNGRMQNKRTGLVSSIDGINGKGANNFHLLSSARLSGSSPPPPPLMSAKLRAVNQQQDSRAQNFGTNAAASALHRQYLNPLASSSMAADNTRASQDQVIYGDQGLFSPPSLGSQSPNPSQVLGLLRVAPAQLNAALAGNSMQQPQQQAFGLTSTSPLVRRNSPLPMALLTNGAGHLHSPIDYLTGYSSAGPAASLPYNINTAPRFSRSMQQSSRQRAYQNRIGRHEPGGSAAGAGGSSYDDGAPAASVATTSTSDPMWSDTQNHEEDYQQSPQTIQITAVPNGLGLGNPGFVGNGFNGFNGFNGLNGWGGPWNGRQVLLVNKQPQAVGSEWRSWLIPVAIILALPLILGALFIPVFLKSVMFLIQILQMLGLLMPPSQLASHLLSNTHSSQSG